jgi:hypothetical protein
VKIIAWLLLLASLYPLALAIIWGDFLLLFGVLLMMLGLFLWVIR